MMGNYADRFMKSKEVCQKIQFGKSWLFDNIAKGNFPKPIHITGKNSARWLESEVNEWMVKQIKNSQPD